MKKNLKIHRKVILIVTAIAKAEFADATKMAEKTKDNWDSAVSWTTQPGKMNVGLRVLHEYSVLCTSIEVKDGFDLHDNKTRTTSIPPRSCPSWRER
jgi:hypothetical protein